MGRPTTDPKTKHIKLRINEEMEEDLRRFGGGNVSQGMRELIEIGLQRVSDGDGLSRDYKDALAELNRVAMRLEIRPEDLLMDFILLLDDGVLKVRNKTLVAFKEPKRWKEVLAMSKAKKTTIDKVIDGLLKISGWDI